MLKGGNNIRNNVVYILLDYRLVIGVGMFGNNLLAQLHDNKIAIMCHKNHLGTICNQLDVNN